MAFCSSAGAVMGKVAETTAEVTEATVVKTVETVAEKAVKVEFDTETPAMHHVWTLNQGWTRAEHYVYCPLGSSTFQRLSRSTAAWDFWLHTATPVTSM